MAAKKSVFNEDNFIPGVFNYCNSWCERCRFRLRCRNYAMMADDEGNPIDLDEDGAMERIEENMRKAMGLLKDWSDPSSDEDEQEDPNEEEQEETEKEWRAEMDRDRNFARNHPLAKVTMTYSHMARRWLDGHQELMDRKVSRLKEMASAGPDKKALTHDHEELTNASEVVYWYVFMIHVKTQRALHGLSDMNDSIWESPVQSDANGSAKVALLSAEASMSAWITLTETMPEVLDEILPLLAQLQQTIMGLLKVFPDARRFVRPGFDE